MHTAVNDHKLTLLFKLNFKETIYSADYYGTFKAYVDKVLDVETNSLVVLKKK